MGASPGAGAGCDCRESRHPSRAAARTAPRDSPDGLSETQSSNPHRPTRGHVCMLSCTDKSPIREGWPGRGKNRNLVQCTSDALDRARRDDSALSDICLHVFQGPPGGRGNRFLCGAPGARRPEKGCLPMEGTERQVKVENFPTRGTVQ